MRTSRLLIALLLLTFCLTLPAYGEEPSYLRLGEYPTGAAGEKAPILWRVLDVGNEGMLLLSEFVLDARPAQSEGKYIGYEYSTLKTWLQGEFFETAFTPAEQALLARTEGAPEVSVPSLEVLRKRDGGFLEVSQMRTGATEYAKARGVQTYRSGDASYWVANRATSDTNGQRRVMDEGNVGYAITGYANIGVRPLIRLVPGAADLATGGGTAADPYQLKAPELAAQESAQEAAPDETPNETPVEAPAETPQDAPAGQALMTEGFPELTPAGFLPEGQAPYIFKDEENGVWRYASQSLRLVINRRQDIGEKLRWFETHIFFTGEEGVRSYPFDENNRRRMSPMNKIADQHNLVYAFNGDYYAYRVNRDRESDSTVAIGRVARNFELLYDQAVSKNRKAHPNLDVMALYPDGRMSVHDANETTAQALLDAGARDVLSFGPWLLRDGEINIKGVTGFGVTNQPRAAIGMIGEGHFLHLVMESRTSKSRGVNTAWMAEKLKELGCHTGFNLDGGQTAVLIFLGEQLNEIGKYDNKTNAREQNEVFGIGQR